MKMFGKYSVSSLFFWLSILCFISITILFIATLYSNLLKAFTGLSSIVQIFFFFIPKLIFFYLLILIFRTFKSDKIFTKKAVNYLHLFTAANFMISLLILLSTKFDINWIQEIVPLFPFAILGVFSAFLAAIFKQGFQLQQENNLTI